jgi:4-amino-4-deoxy-L-arabinose transferase-like glycosyltransferase
MSARSRALLPALALLPVAVLLVVGHRYGFHRDELYFVEAGRHPAWGYADQPPLVPLLATAWHDLVAGSLWAFRAVPALLSGALAWTAWQVARELGGDRRTAAWTAAVVGTASTVLAAFHLFGTTAVDATLSTALLWLLLRAVRTRATPDWVWVGAVAGVALLVKTLPGLLLLCCAVAILVTGHARLLRRPGPWLAVALAAAGAAGPLAWQAANGWPQLELGRAIAAGSSGTSVDTALFVPLLVTLTGPLTTPFWVAGAWSLARHPEHRGRRWLPLAAGLFLVAVLVTGGKPYYLLPVAVTLAAAGVPVVLRWAARRRWRTPAAVAAVATNAVVGAVLVLPLLPPRLALLDVNYDLGEQVGWEELIAAVAAEHREEPAGVVLTRNYGQAGALDRARRAGTDLPHVASGHNGYWWWSRPPDGAAPVLVVTSAEADTLARTLDGCTRRATVTNAAGVDNDEDGVGIWRCDGPVRPWSQLWPDLQRLG